VGAGWARCSVWLGFGSGGMADDKPARMFEMSRDASSGPGEDSRGRASARLESALVMEESSFSSGGTDNVGGDLGSAGVWEVVAGVL
jgi:hypothetical protein